jgi:hypothetical protein
MLLRRLRNAALVETNAVARRMQTTSWPADSDLAAAAARTVVVDSLLGGAEAAARWCQRDAAAVQMPSVLSPGTPACTGGFDVVVVADAAPCPLGRVLVDGYRAQFTGRGGAMPAAFLTFSPATLLDDVRAAARPGAVVVLIQNSAFQNEMGQYRLRLRLFDMGLRVAEHVHLSTMTADIDERDAGAADAAALVLRTYCRACSVDPRACHAEALALASKIDACSSGVTVQSAAGALVYSGPMHTCLFNTGVFDEAGAAEAGAAAKPQRPIGASYPFGEVITESLRLSDLSGAATIFAFPSTQRRLFNTHPAGAPFTIEVERGAVVGTCGNAPPEFLEMLRLVRAAEGVAVLRELGIGINDAVGKRCALADITAFERQRGVHVSMGKRHPLFKKPKRDPAAGGDGGGGGGGGCDYDHLRRKDGKYHFDLFIDATSLATNDGALRIDFAT